MPALPAASEEIRPGPAPEPVPQRAARVLLVEDNPDTPSSPPIARARFAPAMREAVAADVGGEAA